MLILSYFIRNLHSNAFTSSQTLIKFSDKLYSFFVQKLFWFQHGIFFEIISKFDINTTNNKWKFVNYLEC